MDGESRGPSFRRREQRAGLASSWACDANSRPPPTRAPHEASLVRPAAVALDLARRRRVARQSVGELCEEADHLVGQRVRGAREGGLEGERHHVAHVAERAQRGEAVLAERLRAHDHPPVEEGGEDGRLDVDVLAAEERELERRDVR
eukprot:5439420-Prymnesium_polylepis.1